MVSLGLGTKNTWLGSGKDCVLAYEVLSLQTRMQNYQVFYANVADVSFEHPPTCLKQSPSILLTISTGFVLSMAVSCIVMLAFTLESMLQTALKPTVSSD